MALKQQSLRLTPLFCLIFQVIKDRLFNISNSTVLSSIDSEMSSPPQQPKFTEERQQKIPVTKATGKNYLNIDILVLIEKNDSIF